MSTENESGLSREIEQLSPEEKDGLTVENTITEDTINTLRRGITMLEGSEGEKVSQDLKQEASILLSKVVPVLYHPNDDERKQLFTRACDAMMNAFFKEDDLIIQENIFETLFSSMNKVIFKTEQDLYLKVASFYCLKFPNESFKARARKYAVKLFTIVNISSYRRTKDIFEILNQSDTV